MDLSKYQLDVCVRWGEAESYDGILIIAQNDAGIEPSGLFLVEERTAVLVKRRARSFGERAPSFFSEDGAARG